MTDFALPHRMADPVVRRRVAALTVALLGLAWVAVTMGGRTGGPYSQEELRHLVGIPFPPPQIESRFRPPSDPLGEFADQFEDLRRRVGEAPTNLQPPAKRR